MDWFTEDPKKPHLIKISFWGKKTYHDPKTGKELRKTKVRNEKLKKPGWF